MVGGVVKVGGRLGVAGEGWQLGHRASHHHHHHHWGRQGTCFWREILQGWRWGGLAKSEILSEKSLSWKIFKKMGVTGEWGGSDIIHIFVDLENNTFSEKLPFKQFFTCFIFHAYFIHNGANSKKT